MHADVAFPLLGGIDSLLGVPRVNPVLFEQRHDLTLNKLTVFRRMTDIYIGHGKR